MMVVVVSMRQGAELRRIVGTFWMITSLLCSTPLYSGLFPQVLSIIILYLRQPCDLTWQLLS